MSALLEDLRRSLAATPTNVVFVVGAGVGAGALRGGAGAALASWTGLLADGLRRSCDLGLLDEPTHAHHRGQLDSADAHALVEVADVVSRCLGAPHGGEFSRWLRETVGRFHEDIRDHALLDLLAAHQRRGVLLATTNYDHLLAAATGLRPVTWRRVPAVERAIRGSEPRVLHLHGEWEEPESIVLGSHSYDEVARDPHAQAVLAALRMDRTFVFLGCGAGLHDPNLGAFLRWTSQVFGRSEVRHFRLCRSDEVAALRGEHPPEQRIFPLSYGDTHADLVPFLRDLLPRGAAASPRLALALTREEQAFQGRDDEARALRARVLGDPPAVAAILGPAGIGKSSLALHVLHDPAVRVRFAERRWFVRLDAATSADGAAGLVAAALGLGQTPDAATLGLGQTPDVVTRVCAALGRAPSVLVLDNLETPWEADRAGTEALLRRLCALADLSLVVSLRGAVSPGGLSRPAVIRVGPMTAEQAHDLFVAIAPEHAGDPRLDALLQPLGGVPLAVVLLARVGLGNDLGNLARDWSLRRTEMLQELGPERDRLTSWAVSLELSWAARRMTDPARALAAVIAALPGGVAHEDLPVWAADGPAAATALVHVGLAHFGASRLQMLAPVREHLLRRHPPDAPDLERMDVHYGRLARELGPKVGKHAGIGADERLIPELANLDAAIRRGLIGADPGPWIDAACAMTPLADCTGRLEPSPLHPALLAAERTGDRTRQAACLHDLARLAASRARDDEARAQLDRALVLYRDLNDTLGEANCVRRLGKLALADEALPLTEQALALYVRVGDPLGEAHCFLHLGELALDGDQYDAGRQRFEQALAIYRRLGDLLGVANCIQSLADVALDCELEDEARKRFTEALPLHRQASHPSGEADCRRGLSLLAFRHSRLHEAEDHALAALPLYRGVGDLLGEAQCLVDLGDIALEYERHNEAERRFAAALPLYRAVSDVSGEADCLLGLGKSALASARHDEAERWISQSLQRFRQDEDSFGEACCVESLGELALARSQHAEAQRHLDQARALFQQCDEALGDADCLYHLGDLALGQSQPDTARARYEQALRIYEAEDCPHSLGETHARLSRLPAPLEEQQRHLEEARRAFEAIHRPDLIAKLVP